jgi:DNA-directed RNA polymerase subunit RPC12/RpoP
MANRQELRRETKSDRRNTHERAKSFLTSPILDIHVKTLPLGSHALRERLPAPREERITLNVPADSEGFLSLSCSRCEQKFRLRVTDYLAEQLEHLFCPACGSRNKTNVFFPQDVQEAINILAENLAAGNIRDLIKDFESPTRAPKNITANTSGMFAMVPEKFPPESKDLGKIRLDCCKKEMKGHCPEKAGSVYCPFCGEIRENPTWDLGK